MLPCYLIYFSSHKNITAEAFFQHGLWLILITYIIAIPVYLLYELPAKIKIKQKFLRANRIKNIFSPAVNSVNMNNTTLD
jgi:hypothetical protein